jgi:hypothetical protein
MPPTSSRLPALLRASATVSVSMGVAALAQAIIAAYTR